MIRVLEFFNSRIGSSVIFIGIVFVVFYFIREHRERKEAAQAKAEAQRVNVEAFGKMSPEKESPNPNAAQVSEWVDETPIDTFRPRPYTPPAPPQPNFQTAPVKQIKLPKLVHTYTETKPKEPPKKAPELFAPRGTLVRCQLVNTIDTGNLETPIIGMVTEDVWHNGQLVVPAGTRVHHSAQFQRIRDRISAQGVWTFVWFDGREYRINGIALDREYFPGNNRFGLTDGSAGIRGQVLQSDSLKELKIFAATAIAAAARSSEETALSIFGSRPVNSLQNAALEGGASVAQQHAQLLQRQIGGDGLFVRATAGTEFYIYTQDVFEPEMASIAGLKQTLPALPLGPLQDSAIRYQNLVQPNTQERPSEGEKRAILERRDALIHLHKHNGIPVPTSP